MTPDVLRTILSALVMTFAMMFAMTFAACGSDGTGKVPAPALLHEPPAKVAPSPAQALASPAALVQALSAPHAPLGAFSLTSHQTIRVALGGSTIMTLETEDRLLVDSQGDFDASRSTSDGLARALIWSGGLLYVGVGPPPDPASAPGQAVAGKLHRRPPTSPDEPAKLSGEAFGAFGDSVALVARWAKLSDGGPVEVAGRAGHKIRLALASAPGPAIISATGSRAWRESLVVTALSGEAVLDDRTGLPLAGKLHATGTFVRAGKTYALELGASHELGPAAGTVVLPAADMIVDTPERSHDVAIEDGLLEGLAPRHHRGPAAAPGVP
jgi:hypothetical protein